MHYFKIGAIILLRYSSNNKCNGQFVWDIYFFGNHNSVKPKTKFNNLKYYLTTN